MKKIVISVFVLMLAFPALAQQEEGARYNNVLKLNFDGIFDSRYQLGYERVIGKYTSVNVNIGGIFDIYKQERESGNYLDERRKTGFLIVPEFRVYMSEFTKDRLPSGFFFSAYFRYLTEDEENNRNDEYEIFSETYDRTYAGFGLLAGFQMVTSFGLGFEAYVGPEYRYSFIDHVSNRQIISSGTTSDYDSSTIEQETVPYAGVSISYAF